MIIPLFILQCYETELTQILEKHIDVENPVRLVKDRNSNSRGIAFIDVTIQNAKR